jgi:hypothetical protein
VNGTAVFIEAEIDCKVLKTDLPEVGEEENDPGDRI